MAISRVLAVDDSKTQLMHLRGILEPAGYAVTTVENAEEAMAELERQPPDLILMDVVMPGKNGFHLTRTIHRDPRFAEIPIVFCTSKDQASDRAWGMRQGASAYLVKPISKQVLLGQITMLGGSAQ